MCGPTALPGIGFLADRDYSVELAGVTCKPVPAALMDENGVSLARAFRIALRLVDEIGLP